MNTETFKILKPKQDQGAPGVLAQELADAREAFEAKRQDVIARGADRQAHLRDLAAEIEQEQAALDGVLTEAQK